jgi:hypothetical protein
MPRDASKMGRPLLGRAISARRSGQASNGIAIAARTGTRMLVADVEKGTDATVARATYFTHIR